MISLFLQVEVSPRPTQAGGNDDDECEGEGEFLACPRHPTEASKLYCEQCDTPVCVTCKLTAHEVGKLCLFLFPFILFSFSSAYLSFPLASLIVLLIIFLFLLLFSVQIFLLCVRPHNIICLFYFLLVLVSITQVGQSCEHISF